MRPALLAIAALVLATASFAFDDRVDIGRPAVVGEAYPPLRLPTIERDATIDLADFRGKRVLLIEFASW